MLLTMLPRLGYFTKVFEQSDEISTIQIININNLKLFSEIIKNNKNDENNDIIEVARAPTYFSHINFVDC